MNFLKNIAETTHKKLIPLEPVVLIRRESQVILMKVDRVNSSMLSRNCSTVISARDINHLDLNIVMTVEDVFANSTTTVSGLVDV